MGSEPDTSGTTKGTLHRIWIDFRTAITEKDNLAVLEECERAEDVALEAYQDALKEEMPETLRSLITQQLEGVKKIMIVFGSLETKQRIILEGVSFQ